MGKLASVCKKLCQLGELVAKHVNQFPGKQGVGAFNEMLIWWRGRALLKLIEGSTDATSKKWAAFFGGMGVTANGHTRERVRKTKMTYVRKSHHFVKHAYTGSSAKRVAVKEAIRTRLFRAIAPIPVI